MMFSRRRGDARMFRAPAYIGFAGGSGTMGLTSTG
jgi:hypothetical protein